MAYGKDRIMRDSHGEYVLNALGERMRMDPERAVTARDLFRQLHAPRPAPVTPAVPVPYIEGQFRKPVAPILASSVAASSSSNVLVARAPTGRGQTIHHGPRHIPASRNPSGGRGRGNIARGGASNPANTTSMPGPTYSFPPNQGNVGFGPANALTGTASFIQGNIDPALFGNSNNSSPFSGFMGPPTTGSSLPPLPSSFGGYNPPPNPNGGVPSGLELSPDRPSNGFPLGRRSNRHLDDIDVDEDEDVWSPAQHNAHNSFGGSAAGPSGFESYDYPPNDNYMGGGGGFGSSAGGPSGMNTHNALLTGNDMGSEGFGSSNSPSGPADKGKGPAQNIPKGKTRGAAGEQNDVRRTAILAAGCPCKRCWVSWLKTPQRECILKLLNCAACRETVKQCCIWSDAVHIPAIQHIVYLHNIFLAWLQANPTFVFDREILDRLNPRGGLKKGHTWPATVPQEYLHMANAIQALRLLDTQQ